MIQTLFKYAPQRVRSLNEKKTKIYKTVRHNKHPVIVNPSYGEKFEEYKILGTQKLKARAELVRKNKEFAEKIQSIKRSE